MMDAASPAKQKPTSRGPAGAIEPAAVETRCLVGLAIGLAAVCVASKFALLPFPVSSLGDFARWVLRLGVVTAADICFVSGFTCFCWLLLKGLQRWGRGTSLGWRVVVMMYHLAAVYMVVAVPLFRITLVPFSVRFFAFVGSPWLMASSVREFVTPLTVAALFAAPLAMVIAVFATRRLAWPVGSAAFSRPAALAAVVLVATYGSIAHAYIQYRWDDPNRWEWRIAQNPHFVLLASCVEELTKDRPFTFEYEFDEVDERDFVSHAATPEDTSPLWSHWPPDVARPKNVFMIVLESVGAEYASVCGSEYATMPRLDRRVQQGGVVFDNLYVQTPYSCKSLFSLITGIYPRPDWRLVLRDSLDFEIPTVAEVLAEQGYRSCYLHSGFWSWKYRDRYFGRGGVSKLIDAESLPGPLVNSWGVSDRTMFDAALKWIDEGDGQPFFGFAFTIETHHPYAELRDPIDFGTDDSELTRYLNAIRGSDLEIDRFLRQLDKRGLLDDTLVIVTADHGEAFGQHQQWGHGFGVYLPNLRIPFVMLHPGLRGLPHHIDRVRQQIDVAPTIVDLLDVERHPLWQGRNLFRKEEEPRVYFLSLGHQVVLGVRDGQYKYHHYIDTDHEELFDLSRDPHEERNIAQAQPERCREYRRRTAGFVSYQRRFLARHGAP